MYELTQLFWNRPIFMCELLAAEILFIFSLKRRNYFILRAIASVVLCIGFSFAIPIVSYDAVYCSFMFFAMFFFSVMMLKFCYKESYRNIIFCAIAGYTAQHMAYQLYNLSLVVMGAEMLASYGAYGSEVGGFNVNPFVAMVYFFFHGVTYWILYMIFGKRIKKGEELQLKSVAMLILVILIIFVDIVMNLVIIYHGGDDISMVVRIAICLYNVLCCVLTLCIQFELSMRKRLEKELDTEKHLRYMEKEQYWISKENIELINLKCHDLKHQIRLLGNNNLQQTEFIERVESVISIYDSSVKTGNNTLDVILTEKSLLCNKNSINLSCIVDGGKLSFLNEEDTYSLFGNIIDNAIEAVINLEIEKRVIGLTVRNVGEFLSVNVHNYYDKEISYKDGLPQTTKPEKEFHGYGLRSIQRIVEKYEGDLSINSDNNIFNLNILFPIVAGS